jgi:hypothetical protein
MKIVGARATVGLGLRRVAAVAHQVGGSEAQGLAGGAGQRALHCSGSARGLSREARLHGARPVVDVRGRTAELGS